MHEKRNFGAKIKVLVVTPDPELMGGVVDTVRLMFKGMEDRCSLSRAVYGRRRGQGRVLGYVQPLLDLIRFVFLFIENGFNVIHLNPSFNLRSLLKESFLVLLCCLFGYSGKILLYFHGWDIDLFERIFSNSILRYLLRQLLCRAGIITVLSREYADLLLRLGVPGYKLKVVSTMFDASELPDEDPKVSKRFYILFLSRIVRKKGVYELVAAFAELSTRHHGLKLILAGDGEARNDLQAKVGSEKLENIIFTGFITGKEKYRAFAECGIFVLPTHFSEGCPVSLLEAMGAGLVPVVPLAGGIKDIVEPDRTALILDHVTVRDIVANIEKLLADERLWRNLSSKSKEIAREKFDYTVVCDELFSLYEILY